MFTKNILIYSLLGVLFVLLNRCKDDNDKVTQAPQITEFELGVDNSASVYTGEDLTIKATLFAEGVIDQVLIEIKPKSTSNWEFNAVYEDYSGKTDCPLIQNIPIPIDADSGMYLVTLTLIDMIGNMSSTEKNLNLLHIEIPYKTPFEEINGFIIDANGTKQIASNKGVFALNMVDKKFLLIEENIDLIPATDLALTPPDFSEELWIASNKGALNYNSRIQFTTRNSELLSNKVNRLTIDNTKAIYFATDMGISINKNEVWYENLGTDSLYLNYKITDIAAANNGYTYATTNGGGIERFKADVDGISGATVFDTDWAQLRSNNVFCVFIDDTVQAYGTDAGAAIHSSEYTKWDWEFFTTKEGLINDTVLSIVKDNQDHWWFGTSNGLSKMKMLEWTNYTAENDGFFSAPIKFMAIDLDGTLWIATDKGLSHFENDKWTNY